MLSYSYCCRCQLLLRRRRYRIDELAKFVLALPQCLLRPFVVVDVDIHTVPANDVAIAVAQGFGMYVEPAIRSVGPAKPARRIDRSSEATKRRPRRAAENRSSHRTRATVRRAQGDGMPEEYPSAPSRVASGTVLLALDVGAELLDAVSFAFGMFWEILWALILGFALSGAVQAVVSKREMRRLLPDDSPRSLARATVQSRLSRSSS